MEPFHNSQSNNIINQKHFKRTLHECPYKNCYTSFHKKSILNEHLRFHAGLKAFFTCHTCGKTCSSPQALHLHKSTHRAKHYDCYLCEAGSMNCSNLSFHLDGHNDDTAHTCGLCMEMFSKIDSLLEHLRQHKFLPSETIFCHICGKEYRKLHFLARHLTE